MAFSVPENVLRSSFDERVKYAFSTPGLLELCHNHGDTMDSPNYHNSNTDPKGFGHIGICVDNVVALCSK